MSAVPGRLGLTLTGGSCCRCAFQADLHHGLLGRRRILDALDHGYDVGRRAAV